MSAPVVVLGLVGLAAVFVLLPVGFAAYSSYRRPLRLRCPVTERDAEVRVGASGAAVAAAFGGASARVRVCSQWPETRACGQECVLGRWRHD